MVMSFDAVRAVYPKWWLGLVLVIKGVLMLGDWDKRFEAWAVERSPAWPTELTTRY